VLAAAVKSLFIGVSVILDEWTIDRADNLDSEGNPTSSAKLASLQSLKDAKFGEVTYVTLSHNKCE
jgi:hypothetical protein